MKKCEDMYFCSIEQNLKYVYDMNACSLRYDVSKFLQFDYKVAEAERHHKLWKQ